MKADRILLAVLGLIAASGPVLAGAPAPIIGTGLPGLVLLGVVGAGYVGLRQYRKSRSK